MNEPFSGNRSRLYGGLFLIALGLIFYLDLEGIVPARQIFRFWPSVLIVAGLFRIFTGNREHRLFWGGVLIAMGALFQVHALHSPYDPFSLFWPVLLILTGVAMIWWTFEGRKRSVATPDSYLDHIVVFGGSKFRVDAKDFRGGRLLAVCGGFEIDLRDATLQGEEAEIEANAIMGGGEIRVPESWNVRVNGSSIMGGYVDNTRGSGHKPVAVYVKDGDKEIYVDQGRGPSPEPVVKDKTLVVKGIAVLGGINIRN
jgi:predicted membrane protein